MKKVLSMVLVLTMLVCMSVPALADSDSGFIFYIEIAGLQNTEGTDAGSLTKALSDTPYCLLEQPENLTTKKEGQVFVGLFCNETEKLYQFGDTIPLEDFSPYQDGYRIRLQATFTKDDPDVHYTDVYEYTAVLNIVNPIEYDAVANTIERTYDPASDVDVGEADYKFNARTLLGRYPVLYGITPEGYRSMVTGNVFYLGDTYDLDKLPAAEFVGLGTNEISDTETERIHYYEINDYLIPLYSFNGVTGGFSDPLYECSIIYYVPAPLSNGADLNAAFGTVGTQTVSGITMEELTAPDYTITLNGAPDYTGYIFDGYSLLTETEVTVPDDHQIVLSEQDYISDTDGHIRLSMKLHYSIDPDYTPGIQNKVTYDPNNGVLPVTGSAPADENLYVLGVPFMVMGQGTLAMEGYEFIGWNTKADGSGTAYRENDMAPMTEEAILYAQWKPEGSVLFELNGNGGFFGSETSKELYMLPLTAFSDAEGYEEPVREGFVFIGWAGSPEAAAPDITVVPDSDNTVVYAVWSRKTDIRITFDAVNGSEPQEAVGTFEADLTVPADPTRTGYTFGGWNTMADGTGDTLDEAALFPGSDTTYYAQWIPNEITVRFLPGEGGSIISGMTETELHTGETLWDVVGFTFPEIETNDDYTFLGWRSNSGEFYESAHDTAQMVMNHIFTGAQDPEIFTAEYSLPDQTRITFDYAGGTDNDGADSRTFTDYEYHLFDESLVPTPELPGFLFLGWDADIPTEYPASGSTVTLHALWEDVRHTVIFEMNGQGTVPEDQLVIDGSTAEKPEDPVANGYTFDGWYADASFSAVFDFETAITGDTVIYARWSYAGKEFPFIDVHETDWSYEDIVYVYQKGMMLGTSETTFEPDLPTSRAMIVTILWRLEGEPVVNYAMSFTDVTSDQWYTEAIRWAQANGIVKGYSTEEFGTDDPITREQMAAILYRYADFKGYDVRAAADLSGFEDYDQIDGWALDAVAWANANSLINGISADKLSPKGFAARDQAAAILHRFCENIMK